VTEPVHRQIKSRSPMLTGKRVRFLEHLYGERDDLSGRSVIVVGPKLMMYEFGLTKEMVLELFKTFVMKVLVGKGLAHNIMSAKRKIQRVPPEFWDDLEYVIKEHPVLLNRAPTLTRLGIKTFEPTLADGRTIHLHPLVFTAYN
ncbi:DNA-directed RNA polymerase subunit beta', partial [Bacillus cereus]|nr:DNA-directed RNA polymerase subunit beta' [Bacillus cereus]